MKNGTLHDLRLRTKNKLLRSLPWHAFHVEEGGHEEAHRFHEHAAGPSHKFTKARHMSFVPPGAHLQNSGSKKVQEAQAEVRGVRDETGYSSAIVPEPSRLGYVASTTDADVA